jgi:hypothetical protein
MKKYLLLCIILLGINARSISQDHKKYSKRELREIVKLQQSEINSLLLKQQELNNLKEVFHTTEQQKFNCLAEKNQLEKRLLDKDNEIARSKKDKELLASVIKECRNEINEKNKTLDLVGTTVTDYSTPFLKTPPARTVIRESYKEYTRRYITGPRGGCYYINGNGNKTYVDRSLCH